MKLPCFLLLLLALVSCKSVDPRLNTVHRDSVAYTIHQSIDTILLHDSIYIHERQKGDTVYLTRTEWRERWRTQIVHDTIRNTEYITQVIEKPPIRYVPKFYKWCTAALWAVLGVLVVVVVLKVRLRGVR